MTEILLAVIGVIGIVGAGAGKDIVQLIRSRKAGVKNRDVQAQAQAPAKGPDAIDGFDRLVDRLEGRSSRLEARLDHVEAWNVTQGDHIDVLENHIWLGKPPPPPPRPRYTPFADAQNNKE